MPEVDVVLVVDVANLMGSRPDGWWRDRAGAAARWVTALGPTPGQRLPLGADGATVRVHRVIAVLEGRARDAAVAADSPVEVVLAAADGDTTVVALADDLVAAGEQPVVVTADRGLRARLPAQALCCGPGRLRDVLVTPAAGAPSATPGSGRTRGRR